jgi:hypothetical protein
LISIADPNRFSTKLASASPNGSGAAFGIKTVIAGTETRSRSNHFCQMPIVKLTVCGLFDGLGAGIAGAMRSAARVAVTWLLATRT